VGSPLLTKTSTALMLGGTVPENKMMGTSGLTFFISFASSDPVVPCNMWSDIVAHTGASRRILRASAVVVTPMTLKPFCSRTFFRNVRYSSSSSIQRISGLVAATGRILRNRASYRLDRTGSLERRSDLNQIISGIVAGVHTGKTVLCRARGHARVEIRSASEN
jgi:hypothetical protein